MANNDPNFEERKRDHLRIALDPSVQSSHTAGLESVDLIHEALPDLDFEEINLSTEFHSTKLSSPIFISSMTAGHDKGREINLALARFSDRHQILMGVGSQRRELTDTTAIAEWKEVRKVAPKAILAGNIGIAQAIQAPLEAIQRLVDGLEAKALFIHLNPLQECLQPEGTPHFKGGLKALTNIAKNLKVPVIVKETGCGFSLETLKRLDSAGIYAVDMSGLGGTHWGRVEGQRLPSDHAHKESAGHFADWGISTVKSLTNAREAGVKYHLWASGGVRSGVDVAKLCAMGAEMVGIAKPWLEAAIAKNPDEALNALAKRLEFELKTSLFCTGSRNIGELQGGRKWQWRT